MKAPYFLFLLVLLLMACQTDSEEVPGSTPAITQISPAEQTVTPMTKTAPSAPSVPPPTFTEGSPTEVVPPTAQGEEELAPTAIPSATAVPAGRPASSLNLVQVSDGLIEPLYLTHAGDDRLFIVEKRGTIRVLEGGQLSSTPFLDIRDRILSSGYEQGLLSVAFHPEYGLNGYFYVNYTDQAGATIIARFQREATNPNQANLESEQILMRIPQPFVNHNGGQLQFGPDGYLYIGMGDGGSAGDPQQRGQDRTTYLGKLLRIDVDGNDPYSLPEDNPFVGMSSIRNEIWAIGLRNPWRFSFDRQTGDLFVADVGQSLWEEINFQLAGSEGGENYGWDIMEGNHCFSDSNCDSSGLLLPVGEYGHEAGNCSVTGGYVYRGGAVPEMNGNYVFADYCSGSIWRLYQSPDGTWSQAQIADTDLFISSFGEDISGELYLLDLIGGAVYSVALQ